MEGEQHEHKDPHKEENPIQEIVDEISLTDKFRENPWILSTLVLGILALVLIVGNFAGGITGNVISGDDAGEMLLEFYEANGADGLTLDSVEEVSGLYKVNFEYQGAIVPVYVTKDGKFAGSLNSISTETNSESESVSEDIPKADVPVIELFVMTHCPYGTQAEKGFVPVVEAIGDKVDMKIRFVHYFMHEPEETETPRQVCIREEQGDKYISYLREFLKEGDSDAALSVAGIDVGALNNCIAKKADAYYAEDSGLSEEYGVRGSPTLVVNGQIISSGRSPADYLDVICQAFSDDKVPEECGDLELDDASPTAMWGWESSGAATTAQC